jgi:hypothetical protein
VTKGSQPDGYVSDKTIEQAKTRAEPICGKVTIGALAIRKRGPKYREPSQFTLNLLLFRLVAAALQQLHCNEPRKSHGHRKARQPVYSRGVTAQKVHHHVRVEQHAATRLIAMFSAATELASKLATVSNISSIGPNAN